MRFHSCSSLHILPLLVSRISRTELVSPSATKLPPDSPLISPLASPSPNYDALFTFALLEKGHSIPASPPAPETAYANCTFVEVDSHTYECIAEGHVLRYCFTSATSSLSDLTVEANNLLLFSASFFGGLVFVLGEKETPLCDLRTLVLSHTESLLATNELEGIRQARIEEQRFLYTHWFCIRRQNVAHRRRRYRRPDRRILIGSHRGDPGSTDSPRSVYGHL